MAKRKGQKDKQQSTKYYTENERSSNRNLNAVKIVSKSNKTNCTQTGLVNALQ